MDYISQYLNKQPSQAYFTDTPPKDLFLCLVIPCFNEPNLVSTLQSLWDCQRPKGAIEVIVVINSPDSALPETLGQNEKTFADANNWVKSHFDPKLRFLLMLKPNLPDKDAGVGLARKLGMDEAVRRFKAIENPTGIIAGFDADSTCDTNYFTAIEAHFAKNPKTNGASIYFEHPTAGVEFDEMVYRRIVEYELHLRYMNQALRFAGHPHAYHTVGSSFAVTTDAYVKQGGMNKRQAGEDFYFLQKIISTGNFTEINTTRVIPSPRESNRVPFGTGAAMRQLLADNTEELKTYCFESYMDVEKLIQSVSLLYGSDDSGVELIFGSYPPLLKEFLHQNQFFDEVKSIRANVSSQKSFEQRFFKWFNAFRVIKYLNYSHSAGYSKESVSKESARLAALTEKEPKHTAVELLGLFRTMDRTGFGLNRQ